MATGKPDWQDVPRGFNARLLLDELVDLNAGANTSRTILAADADDVVGVYVGAGSGESFIVATVASENPNGDIVSQVRHHLWTVLTAWIPVQAAGGDVTVTLANTSGTASNDIPLRAWSYIGLSAGDLLPQQNVIHSAITNLAAGGSVFFGLFIPSILSEISVVATLGQAFIVRSAEFIPNQNTATPTSVAVPVRDRVAGAAGAVAVTTWQAPAIGSVISVFNNSGVVASGSVAVVQRQP